MADIQYIVKVDSKTGEASLQRLDKQVEKLPKSSAKATLGFKSMWTKLLAGYAAIQTVTRLWRSLTGAIREYVGLAIEQEKQEKKIEAVLRSTHNAAGLTKQDILDMARAYQKMTTYGDEAVLSAQHMLLTFTNISKDVFPDALETVLNMSQALGQDLKASSIQVGKALNDPILGATALRRVGVNLTDEMKEQIKTFMEHGEITKAQKLILSELATEFGGTARAARDTFGGALEALSNIYKDLKEQVGEAISGNEEFRDLIQDLTVVLTEFVESGKLKTYIDELERLWKVVRYLPGLAPVQSFVNYMDRLADKAEDLQAVRKEAKAIIDDIRAATEIKEPSVDTSKIIEPIKLVQYELAKIPPIWDEVTDLLADPEAANQFEIMMERYDEASQEFLAKFGFGLGTLKGKVDEVSEAGETALDRLVSAYQTGLDDILGTLKRWAIGEAVKFIFSKIPFPFSVPVAWAAVKVIEGVYKAISGLEKGGIVMQEGLYRIGERGKKEAVIPLEDLPRVMSSFTTNVNNFRPQLIHVHVHIGGKEVDSYIINTTQRAGQIGKLKLPAKVIQQ